MNIETRIIDPEDESQGPDAVDAMVLMGRTLFWGQPTTLIYVNLFHFGKCRGAFDEETGRLLGVGVSMIAARESMLLAMAVDPEARRRRIGSTLLSAIEADAVEAGATRMNLKPVDEESRAFFVANHYVAAPSEAKLLQKQLPQAPPPV